MAVNPGNWQLAQQLEEAFNQIGTSMMSDEFAAKLLAFTYVLGGEVTVLHEGLNAGIAMASQKFNIKGGEIPHADKLPILNKYIKEMEEGYDKTPWLSEIYTRYNITSANESGKSKSKRTTKQLELPDGSNDGNNTNGR